MAITAVDGNKEDYAQMEADLKSIEKNGHDDKVAVAILKNAKNTNLESDDEDEAIEVSYTLTEQHIDKWEAIRNKYYPEGETFAKKTIM